MSSRDFRPQPQGMPQHYGPPPHQYAMPHGMPQQAGLPRHAGMPQQFSPQHQVAPGVQIQVQNFVEESGNGCFPITLCGMCPLGIRMLVPETFNHIQDGTHLCLMLGVISGLCIIVQELRFWFVAEQKDNITFEKFQLDISRAVLVALAVLPNMMYFCKTMGQFKASIQSREKSINEQKRALIEDYEGYILGMDEMLGRATQSSASLAESGFEAKKRDFVRFLDRVEERAGKMVVPAELDMDSMRLQFIDFVKNWLQIFAECSVDPINRPKYVLSEEELMYCRTVPEIASLVKNRLRQTEVQFIRQAREQDAEMLQGFRAMQSRFAPTAQEVPQQMHMGHGGDIEMTTQLDVHRPQRQQQQQQFLDIGASMGNGMGNGMGGAYMPPAQGYDDDEPCYWLTCGCGLGCGCFKLSQTQTDGCPRSVACCCMELVLLSREHLWMIVGFLSGCLVMGFEGVTFFLPGQSWSFLLPKPDTAAQPPTAAAGEAPTVGHRIETLDLLQLIPLAIFCVTLLIVMRNFDKIDLLQKLERDCIRLQAQREHAEERHQMMVDFWGEVQVTADIWAHRTAPRLELYKEVHSCVEDIAKGGDMATLNKALTGVNKRVEAMERKLPALAHWKRDGGISEASKQQFSSSLKTIYDTSNADLPKILSGVKRLTQDTVPAIEGLPSDSRGRSSRSAGRAYGAHDGGQRRGGQSPYQVESGVAFSYAPGR